MSILVENDRDRQKILSGKKQAFLRYWPKRRAISQGSEHNLHDAPRTAPFARIKVVDVFPIRLSDIKEKDALALGFNSVAEFKHVWRGRHGSNKTMMSGETTFFLLLFRVIERF